jgi:hypothetical protein
MADKSKRVKLELEDSTTGKVRTFYFTLPTLASDDPQTNQDKNRVVILRRKLNLKRVPKGRVKII